MRFGFRVPIFANPGVPHFRTPNLETVRWETVEEAVRSAESLGFDSVWVADHLFLGRDGAILEGWTTLSALAAITRRVRVGPIHLANGFRHPAITAKMVATLDVISNGRFEFFVDHGWRAREYEAYGLGWSSDVPERVARLREMLEICELLWTGEVITYQGPFTTVLEAVCNPAPVQAGGPRIWLGEAGDEALLDLIAERADVWNSIPASLELLASKMAAVDAACMRRGRNPGTLVRTMETQVLVYRSRADADALFARFARLRERYPDQGAMADIDANLRAINPRLGVGDGTEGFEDEWVMGTVGEVTERLAAYRDLGIEEVICWFMDFPEMTSMRAIATEVAPRLRGSAA